MAAKHVTISKAASLVGEKVFILKNWEEEFSEFINIKRDEKNARLLTPENIEMLRKIKSFKDSNMDTQTIKQLLSNQQSTIADEVNTSVNSDVVEEMKESLTKITKFIDSKEVQEILQLNEKLNQLEKNVVQSVNHKITETAKLQTEVARFEFSDVQDMISSLEETSHLERELYKEEIQNERDLAEKHTDAREERFLAFVKEHQVRQERIKHDQKFGLGFIKQIMGFAK